MGLRVSNCLFVFVPVLPSNKGAVGFWWEKWSFRFFAKGGVCLAYDGALYLPCRISHAWESNSFISGPCGLALVPSFLLSAPFPRLWCSVLKKNLALLTIAEISVFWDVWIFLKRLTFFPLEKKRLIAWGKFVFPLRAIFSYSVALSFPSRGSRKLLCFSVVYF